MGDPPLPMVSSSTGSMNSILDKLRALEALYPHHTEGVQESLKSLNDALHSFAGRRVRNSVVNEWMLQVRELVYDMEDWIDGCLIGPSKLEEAEFFRCSSESDVAEQIEDFKAQIQDARERCTRYGLLLNTASSPPAQDDAAADETASKVAMDPKLLYGEAPCLVAMDTPKNKNLVEQLTDGEQRRKVVCIVGTRGIGKTTLATEIYRRLQRRFSCWAFVRLGRRNPSVKTTLISILKQVLPEWYCEKDLWSGYNYDDLGAWDEKKVVAKLWAYLKTKSYFIVLDDMRSMRTWKIISCALPNKDKFSDGILITTCSEDVAKSCCIHPNDFVHQMEGLNKNDSKTLFDSKILPHSEQNSLLEASDDMLEMCGGMPLAITVTAGLLSRNSACQPPHDQQCHSTPQGMITEILEMSYYDLPLPVKSCFLYLSAFPENYTIKKDRLIRRWGAEGLLVKRDGEISLWETGESHFNELINRRLIQPAFDEDSDEPTGCTVHGVVFDFVESLSAEENFVTEGAKLKCGLFPYNRVRRVCLDCGEEDDHDDALFSSTYCSLEQKSDLVASSSLSSDEESSICAKDEAISLHLSQVRSLAFSGDVRRIPDLSVFKLVRVLDLSDSKGLENELLGTIGRLSLLSYLGLGRVGGADVVTELPQQIMELEHLSTLDLRQAEVKRLPEFKSTKLVSLLANDLTIAGGMGEMENLEELSTVCLGRDGSLADDVAGLVNSLMRLRMLGVRFKSSHNNIAEAERQGILHFVEAVGKSNLQFLFLDEYPHCLLGLLVDCWTRVRRPRYLRKFELRLDWLLCPARVPQEIRFLVDLTHLHIGVSIVEAQGVRALGELPKLVLLKLYSLRPPSIAGEPQSPTRFSVSSKDGFQRLKVFWYFCEHGTSTGLQLEAGAMPHLRRLLLDFQASHTDFVLGIQHLSCLVQVRATIYLGPTSTTAASAAEAEAHIRDQVSANPNNPVLEFNRKHQGRLLPRPGQPSNVKPAEESSVIAIHSLDEWSIKIVEAQSTNKLVVIQFTAQWCLPSRTIAPFFAHLANKFPNAIFLKVDIDEMKYIAEQFEVTSAPVFLFMNGGEVKDRLRGAKREELVEKLELQMALFTSLHV